MPNTIYSSLASCGAWRPNACWSYTALSCLAGDWVEDSAFYLPYVMSTHLDSSPPVILLNLLDSFYFRCRAQLTTPYSIPQNSWVVQVAGVILFGSLDFFSFSPWCSLTILNDFSQLWPLLMITHRRIGSKTTEWSCLWGGAAFGDERLPPYTVCRCNRFVGCSLGVMEVRALFVSLIVLCFACFVANPVALLDWSLWSFTFAFFLFLLLSVTCRQILSCLLPLVSGFPLVGLCSLFHIITFLDVFSTFLAYTFSVRLCTLRPASCR